MVTHTWNPSYSEAEIGGSGSETDPDKVLRKHYLKNKLKAKGLGHDSTGRVFTGQVWGSPEFNPQYCQKKKKDQGEENLYNKENCSLILITGLCCMDGWLEKPFY
jgi:hypothetical protein